MSTVHIAAMQSVWQFIQYVDLMQAQPLFPDP